MKLLASLFLSLSLVSVYGQNMEVSHSKNETSFQLNIKNNSEKTSLTIKGTVKITDDDKSIAALSKGGSISYRKNDSALKILTDENGSITYTVNNVKKTVLSDQDKKLVEDCVQLMISYGADAENRVNRIFVHKGVKGVLNELNRLEGDLVKEIYFAYLLKQPLPENEMIFLLDKTNQYLKTDYYKTELLSKVMPAYLEKEPISDAYLSAIENVTSAYYQYTLLKKVFSNKLTEKQFNQALYIIKNSKSDYYKSELIQSLFNSPMLTADRYGKVLGAMQNLKNGYYQSAILSQLISNNISNTTEWNKLIWYVGSIDSEYYQSEMLIKIAGKIPEDEQLRKQLDTAARNIKSDYYYGKIKRAIGS